MSQSLLTLRQPGVTLMFDFDSPWTETDLQNWHRLIAKFYETFRDDFPMASLSRHPSLLLTSCTRKKPKTSS
jgi:hypothetical protein